MKKVLITGGSGSVGSAFIRKYYKNYKIYNFSRGEEKMAKLKREFPGVENIIGNISNLSQLMNTFERIKPDIVIHAAALKHVNLAELNPTQTIENNVIGSLNVIKASIRSQVPITVGISTDKSCSPENIYGYSKKIMERIFMEHHNEKTRFVCTRFANVADCEGSVIPLWKNLAKKGESLKLTHPEMNRLMFTTEEAAELINKAIESSNQYESAFILSKRMNSVNMLELAKAMAKNQEITIVGLRPGERLNETLINEKELEFTFCTNDDYIYIFPEKQKGTDNLKEILSSETADWMTRIEINNLIG